MREICVENVNVEGQVCKCNERIDFGLGPVGGPSLCLD